MSQNSGKSLSLIIIILLFSTNIFSQVHITYLWHLEQPIYWPEKSKSDTYHYQLAAESFSLKQNGQNKYSDGKSHPLNDLEEIFSKADRVAVYQYRTKDAVQSMTSNHPESGAQVSYSGCLIENINSLAKTNKWGYGNGWENSIKTARGWKTNGGFPRLDLMGFSMHHALSPLVDENALRKQLQAHKYLTQQTFGTTTNYSKGYFPAECAFSVRIVKVLNEEGFEWSVVANSHLARTLKDYPLSYGTNGCNIDPPNRADIVSTEGKNWWNGQIDGRGGTFAAPYCYQAHKVKYVDPTTGTEYILTIVPMCDLLSYQNGYSTMGTSDIDKFIAPFNKTQQNCIVLMAHDGDNAWGGGYDYYNNSVPGLANACKSKGYVMTTIQQFLNDHPVPENDIVHVEDGAWVNAENDWGHPQFINWIWPLYNSSFLFNPDGWTEDVRNWAVLTAAQNRVETAEKLSGKLNIANIVNPSKNASKAELAWHYLLPAYNSGYMYYGSSLDMEVKQTLACNIAIAYADSVNSLIKKDSTAPTVFIPQRFPYNPGSTGFGPIYNYKKTINSSDFHVWTLIHDYSGVKTATLKYRVDFDGKNALSTNENDIYSGGNGVSSWYSVSLTKKVFPKGNVKNNPDIDFFIIPSHIADLYYAEIKGFKDTLIDYYIEAEDSAGNIKKSPIQHVYVGNQTGTNPDKKIVWTPEFPSVNDTVTIIVNKAKGPAKLHWGVNVNNQRWKTPDNVYRPTGSYLFGGSGPAVETPFSKPDSAQKIVIKLGPFNHVNQKVSEINFVLHYDDNTWDNNGGADYHIALSEGLKIIKQPENKGVCLGSTASISVTVSGAATFQWQQKSNNLWANVIDDQIFKGTTKPTISILAKDSSLNNTYYRCIISDNIKTDTTNAALLSVYDLPSVSFSGLKKNYCAVSGQFDSLKGSPSNGYFSGSGINGTFFYPSKADTGINLIIYSFTDNNGCSNKDSQITYIFKLPEVSLSNFPDILKNSAPFLLSGGLPNGGKYSGKGVINDTFYPALADTGIHTITYTYTDKNNCTNTSKAKIKVYDNSSITEFNTFKSITIKPNPSKDFITINNHLSDPVRISVLTIEGKAVLEEKWILNTLEIDISSLPEGLYIVEIMNKNILEIEKLLKIR